MASRRIRNVIGKEWRLVLTDVSTLLLVTLLPVLIVAQALLYIWLIDHFGSAAILANPLFQSALDKLKIAVPSVAGLAPDDRLRVLLLSQVDFYILLIPTMIAVSMATFSIVDEKQSRSLEALLATPVRTWELLLGKALAGAIPAILVTWVCAGILNFGIFLLGWGRLVGMVLGGSFFIALFLLTPAITILSFMLGVIGSSRAKDAKSAQNMIVVVILPVFALIGVQVTGLVWFTPLASLLLTAGLVLADCLVLRVAVGLFQRESIVVRWR